MIPILVVTLVLTWTGCPPDLSGQMPSSCSANTEQRWDKTQPVTLTAEFKSEPVATPSGENFCGVALLNDDNLRYAEIYSWRQTADSPRWLGLFVNEGYQMGSWARDAGGWHQTRVTWLPPDKPKRQPAWQLTLDNFKAITIRYLTPNKRSKYENGEPPETDLHVGLYSHGRCYYRNLRIEGSLV